MLLFCGTEHKYIIQVHKYKIINILPHNTIHQPLKLDGALQSPSGSTVYSNRPYLVTNAVFS